MPDGNTPEHRTVLTCVDVIIGTHRIARTPWMKVKCPDIWHTRSSRMEDARE
jgi:hypothetical protein